MPDVEHPQVYLVTPKDFELSKFSDQLDALLDRHEVACLRLAMNTLVETEIARAADSLRNICHAHDVPIVIESHIMMVERLGLDGVHLTDGARSVRKTRDLLGKTPIIGSFCGTSKHDALTACESGADYVSFGPIQGASLGDGNVADFDLFAWWSEMIEVPVVAEGGLSLQMIEKLREVTDFIGLQDEIWRANNSMAAIDEFTANLRPNAQ